MSAYLYDIIHFINITTTVDNDNKTVIIYIQTNFLRWALRCFRALSYLLTFYAKSMTEKVPDVLNSLATDLYARSDSLNKFDILPGYK